MKEIILCTFNENKKKELSDIFDNDIKILSLKDINYKEQIIETVYKSLKKPVMADDSGLCVEALNGEPGIYSARYGGKNLNDIQRYKYLLNNLEKSDNLNASFVCSLVLYINPNRIFIIQEEIKGQITFNPSGNNGFGYDPIFYLKDKKKTMAELSSDEKNKISHRGKAAMAMKNIIGSIIF